MLWVHQHLYIYLQPYLHCRALYLAGERIFDWFTPAAMYKHKIPFTICFAAMMFIIFFYCAAEYPIFVDQFATFNPGAPARIPDCYEKTNSTYYGARQMEHWIKSGVSQLNACFLCSPVNALEVACKLTCCPPCRSSYAGHPSSCFCMGILCTPSCGRFGHQ